MLGLNGVLHVFESSACLQEIISFEPEWKMDGWMDYNLKILFPRFSALLRRIHGFVRPSAYPPPDWGNAPHRRVFITLTSCTTWFEYCTTPLHRWSRVCALPRVAAGPETAVHEGTAECGSRH